MSFGEYYYALSVAILVADAVDASSVLHCYLMYNIYSVACKAKAEAEAKAKATDSYRKCLPGAMYITQIHTHIHGFLRPIRSLYNILHGIRILRMPRTNHMLMRAACYGTRNGNEVTVMVTAMVMVTVTATPAIWANTKGLPKRSGNRNGKRMHAIKRKIKLKIRNRYRYVIESNSKLKQVSVFFFFSQLRAHHKLVRVSETAS